MDNTTLFTMVACHAASKGVSSPLLLDVYRLNLTQAQDARLKIHEEGCLDSTKAELSTNGLRAVVKAEALLELGLISGLLTRSDYENRLRFDLRPLGADLTVPLSS